MSLKTCSNFSGVLVIFAQQEPWSTSEVTTGAKMPAVVMPSTQKIKRYDYTFQEFQRLQGVPLSWAAGGI